MPSSAGQGKRPVWPVRNFNEGCFREGWISKFVPALNMPLMSALGQKQTSQHVSAMSAYPKSGHFSGHFAAIDQCPLFPRKQTLVERVGMSALSQKRTSSRYQDVSFGPIPPIQAKDDFAVRSLHARIADEHHRGGIWRYEDQGAGRRRWPGGTDTGDGSGLARH
jgi:hypothetical protein